MMNPEYLERAATVGDVEPVAVRLESVAVQLQELRQQVEALTARVDQLEDAATSPRTRIKSDGPPHGRYYHPKVRAEVVRAWIVSTRVLGDITPTSPQAEKFAAQVVQRCGFQCNPPKGAAVAHWFEPHSKPRAWVKFAKARMGEDFYDLSKPIVLPAKLNLDS